MPVGDELAKVAFRVSTPVNIVIYHRRALFQFFSRNEFPWSLQESQGISDLYLGVLHVIRTIPTYEESFVSSCLLIDAINSYG